MKHGPFVSGLQFFQAERLSRDDGGPGAAYVLIGPKEKSYQLVRLKKQPGIMLALNNRGLLAQPFADKVFCDVDPDLKEPGAGVLVMLPRKGRPATKDMIESY